MDKIEGVPHIDISFMDYKGMKSIDVTCVFAGWRVSEARLVKNKIKSTALVMTCNVAERMSDILRG